jgi:hypothetical protein
MGGKQKQKRRTNKTLPHLIHNQSETSLMLMRQAVTFTYMIISTAAFTFPLIPGLTIMVRHRMIRYEMIGCKMI